MISSFPGIFFGLWGIPAVFLFTYNYGKSQPHDLTWEESGKYQFIQGSKFAYGLQKNQTKALYWMKRAAKQNHPQACRFIGRSFLYGLGMPINLERAREWLLKGARLDDGKSLEYLSILHQKKDDLLSACAYLSLAVIKNSDRNLVRKLKSMKERLTLVEKDALSSKVSSLRKEISIVSIFATNSIVLPKEREYCRITLADGSKYHGQIKGGKPNGYGKKTLRSGEVYLGNFKTGNENGFGISFDHKGRVSFQGLWIMGNPALLSHRSESK